MKKQSIPGDGDPLQEILSPDEVRACSLQLQTLLGEIDSDADEKAYRDCLEDKKLAARMLEVVSAHHWVAAASRSAQPTSAFTKSVMTEVAGTAMREEEDLQLNVAAESGQANWMGWLWPRVASVAALVCLGFFAWRQFKPVEGQPEVSSPGLRLALLDAGKSEGYLVNEAGEKVDRLEPGKRYRVQGKSTILRSGKVAKLRLMEGSVIATGSNLSDPKLRLLGGSLYAHQPGQTALEVACDTFDTSVQGTSLVHQDVGVVDDIELASGTAMSTEGKGMVMVLRGSALIRLRIKGKELTIREGEMYVSGMAPESRSEFLRIADVQVKILKASPDKDAYRKNRELYAEVVKGFRSDLIKNKEKIAAVKNEREIKKLKATRAQIKDLLVTHELRLKEMPILDAQEIPQERAGWLERAVEAVNSVDESQVDPEEWL